MKVLQGCYTPKPHVETMDNVVAFKYAVNPEADDNHRYPKSSIIKEAKGISGTHFFLIHKDLSGNAIFRDKTHIDQQSWSYGVAAFKNGKSQLAPGAFNKKHPDLQRRKL